jgi:hypothetical protein
LATALGHLPQVDLVSFEQALPANDQSTLQAALAGNQNPSAVDLTNAFKQLPAQDVSAAALQVPDIAGYFSAEQSGSTRHEGSNWGGAALAVGAAAGAGYLLHLSQLAVAKREAAAAAARANIASKELVPIALEARPAQLAITAGTLPDAGAAAQALAEKAVAPVGAVADAVIDAAKVADAIPK